MRTQRKMLEPSQIGPVPVDQELLALRSAYDRLQTEYESLRNELRTVVLEREMIFDHMEECIRILFLATSKSREDPTPIRTDIQQPLADRPRRNHRRPRALGRTE
jgi:hypothetical protein